MDEDLDLESALGALVKPDDDLLPRLLKVAKWLSELSPDAEAVGKTLALFEILAPRRRAPGTHGQRAA